MLHSAEPLIEIEMPSFLMPPIDFRHAERVSDHIKNQMTRVTSKLLFPRRVVRLRLLKNVLVAEEGLVFHQDLTVEPSTVRGHDTASIERARQAILRGRDTDTIARAEGDIVLCRCAGARNYGHWLVEMLPMAYMAAHHWPLPVRYLLQQVDEPFASVVHEAYDRLGIGSSERIESNEAPIFIERLVLVEGLSDHGNYIAPVVLTCLDALSAAVQPDPSPRLFVSRGTSPTRKLPSETNIARHLLSAGYVGLAPGNATLSAQIAAFKGARRVVGVLGATMTNLVFTPRGAEAILISPSDMPDTFFWFICGLRDIRLIDMRFPTRRSTIGNPDWDGPFELTDRDEADLIACAAAGEQPLSATKPNARDFFDAEFYTACYGNELPGDADPLEHYFDFGWQMGFDPSPAFSTQFYLRAYPDVASAGVNPLKHYIHCGYEEGRRPQGGKDRRWKVV